MSGFILNSSSDRIFGFFTAETKISERYIDKMGCLQCGRFEKINELAEYMRDSIIDLVFGTNRIEAKELLNKIDELDCENENEDYKVLLPYIIKLKMLAEPQYAEKIIIGGNDAVVDELDIQGSIVLRIQTIDDKCAFHHYYDLSGSASEVNKDKFKQELNILRCLNDHLNNPFFDPDVISDLGEFCDSLINGDRDHANLFLILSKTLDHQYDH
jgi:hypothetical protein